MGNALSNISTRRTLQTLPARADQVQNTAGGYTFAVTDDTRVNRFLTIGVEGGTFYATSDKLAVENAETVIRVAAERGLWLVETIVEISVSGRAKNPAPAIFALAVAAASPDDATRKAALDAVPLVCRTGTHLFQFAGFLKNFRGRGSGFRRAIGGWYTGPEVGKVEYQAVKYRQREGWTHRDLLRLSHPKTVEPSRRALFEWMLRGTVSHDTPDLVKAFVQAQTMTTADQWARLITEHPSLSWEMLPDEALGHRKVWEALLDQKMPMTALLRQLPRLTRLGVLNGEHLALVTRQLTDQDALRKARVHPISVLLALRTYASGRSARGESEWTPVSRIVDVLDAAFYASFGAVEPAGKRTLLALDVSGSMTSPAGGLPISCREVTAAMAMVTMASEPSVDIVGFTGGGGWSGYRDTALTPLNLSPRRRLDDNIQEIEKHPFGTTDCSLPMTWAQAQGKEYDTVVVYTDNETYAGKVHPHQALVEYRRATGIDARLVVVAITPTEFTIADPADAGMLDVSGFDASVPNLIRDFSAGRI